MVLVEEWIGRNRIDERRPRAAPTGPEDHNMRVAGPRYDVTVSCCSGARDIGTAEHVQPAFGSVVPPAPVL